MAYGKHYTLPFKSLANDDCRFDILEKDYSGSVLTLSGGGRSPVVHSWDAEDILTPVWGSKCVLQYVAKNKVIPAGGGMTIVEEETISGWNYTVKFGGTTTNGIFSISLAATNGSNQVFNVNVVAGQTLQSAVDAMKAVIQASTNFIALPTDTGIGLQIFEATLSVFTFTETMLPPASTTPVTIPELPIETFSTTDETKYMGEMYLNNVLQFRGFMVIDDFFAPYLTPPTTPTLTFSDGLGLLDQTTLADAGYTVTRGKISISEMIDKILLLTNIVLQKRTYYNLFHFGSPNRNDDAGIDALSLQFISIKTFITDNDEFENSRTVLEKLLKAADCVLMQQQGFWTVVRQPEYKRFAGNIPGGTSTNQPLVLAANWQGGFSGLGGVFVFVGGAAMSTWFVVGTTFTIANADDSRFNITYEINFVTIVDDDLRVSVYEQPSDPLENVTVTGEFTSETIPTVSAVAPALINTVIGKNGGLQPIERSQTKQFIRPTKKVTNTFTYPEPKLLTNADLLRLGDQIDKHVQINYTNKTGGDFSIGQTITELGGRTAYITRTNGNTLRAGTITGSEGGFLAGTVITNGLGVSATISDSVFDTDYELKDWTNQGTENAFIRDVSDASSGKNLDRFMIIPNKYNPSGTTQNGVVSVPIEVCKGDAFTFELGFRTEQDDNSRSTFSIGMFLDTHEAVPQRYNLIFYSNSQDTRIHNLRWILALTDPGDPFDGSLPYKFYAGQENMAEWRTYNITDYDYNNLGIPRFPKDGDLTIFIEGFNNFYTSGYAEYDAWVKDFKLGYNYYVNETVKIYAQEHKATQAVESKKEIKNDVFIDDAPKYNIPGAIFFHDGTGLVKTTDWIKASGETTKHKFGEINVVDELLLRANWRTMFEGSFYGLCHPVDSFTIDGLDGLFLPFKLELDYRQNRSKLTLQEVSKASDPTFQTLLYNFRYLYK